MITQRIIGLTFICSTLFFATHCRKVKPQPPAAEGFDTAITATRSFLAGQIIFDLNALEGKVNEALSPVLVREDMLEGRKGEQWHLRVERMGPVRIRYARERVTFSAPLRIYVDNPLRLKGPKANRRPVGALAVNVQSPLTVTDNWRLGTRASLVNYRWIEKPSIRLLGLNIRVTRLADYVLKKRRADIEAAIDSAVRDELRLDREVLRIWHSIQKPLLITKQPDSLWLVPKPTSVAVGGISGNRRRLVIPIRVGFQTDTRLGSRPTVTPARRLPRLQKLTDVRETSDLRMLSFVSYADLNQVLKEQLQNRKLALAGGLLNVKEATVYGGQQSLVLKTDVSGAVNGTLYFRGQPVFDTLTYTFMVKNLDFDVHTEELLLSSADWLLHDSLRDTLQAALTFPLGQQILQFPQKIEAAFERGKAGQKTELDIRSFRFVPQRVAIRPDGVQTLIKIESKVALTVTDL